MKPKTSSPRPPAIMAPAPIGILGLGIMGSAIAGNLIKAGFHVVGFDPKLQLRARLTRSGGQAARSVTEVATRAEVILSCLPSPGALDQCIRELADAPIKGLVVIETSTLAVTDKEAARRLLADRGATLLDCPLSGTGAQARNKDLTVYASGSPKEIRRLGAVFEGFAKAHHDLGAFGNGMKMKLMANLLVAVHNVAAAEALLLGERWGIPGKQATQVLSGGAGGSRMLEVRGPMMAERGWDQATMKVSVWQKDMSLIGQALAETCTAAPLFSATIALYNAAVGLGHGEHDTAAVFDVLSRMSSAGVRAAAGKPRRARRSSR